MKNKFKLLIFTSILLISACGPTSKNPSNPTSSTQTSSSVIESKEESTSSSSEKESSSTSSSEKSSSSEQTSSSSSSSEVTSSSSSSSETSSKEPSSSSTNIPSSSEESSSSSSSSQPEPEPIVLETPVVALNEETSIAYWAPVDNALSYNVIINDGEVFNTNEVSYYLNDYSNISVQAVNGEYFSDWSKAVTNYTTVETIYTNDDDIKVFFHDSNIPTQTLEIGEKVTKPEDPTKEHYIFDGFYADPYFKNQFNFNQVILEDTIIYSKWNKEDYINTEFWVKASPAITSTVMSINSSESGWKFIPLTRSIVDNKVLYKTIVNVSGASSSEPAGFLIMDGFTDGGLRNYYKSGIYQDGKELDFLISEDGAYEITFSLDTLFGTKENPCHAKFETYNKISYSANFELTTPVVGVDAETNKAVWLEVAGATSYDVVIDNGEIINTKETSISLNKRSHISVRACGLGIVSKWSLPQGNIDTVYELETETDDNTVSYYFASSNTPSKVVEKGTTIESAPTLEKEGYNFDGWYIDAARKTKAVFPYTVNKNTIFYPNFINKYVTLDQADFKLVNAKNEVVTELKLNLDNYDFLEYESSAFAISGESELYVISSNDETVKYGPYKVSEGKYKIYFSEEHLWDIDTENERNIYLATMESTYYFSNNKHWSNVFYYTWGSTYKKAWPGESIQPFETNSYNEQIFKVILDTSVYSYIIFNNNAGQQTIDIDLTNYPSGTGFYLTEQSNQGWKVGTYTYGS